MKIVFIFVIYKTPEKDVLRLKKEIIDMRLRDYKIYFIDNTADNKGFAYAVNKGLRQALKDNTQLFAVCNPDISFGKVDKEALLDGSKHFDIWGYAMRQGTKIYYGGSIDKWRMSGGLIDKKSKNRFSHVDFVTGSLMVIKRNVIDKIGMFNEQYFTYYEDVEFCYLASKAGFKVGIDNKHIYDHFEVSKNNPGKNSQLAKSRVRFFLKHSNISQKLYELTRLPKTLLEKRSAFFFNFASLNFSSLINKLFHFVQFIIMVRFLNPKDYGIYTLVWANVNLFSPFLDLGTTNYGMVYLPNQPRNKFFSLFSLRVVLSIIVFISTLLSIFFLAYSFEVKLNILLLTFAIFSFGLSGSLLILNSITEKLYISSIVSMVFNFAQVFFTIIALLMSRKLFWVFIILFVSYNIYSFVNFYLIKRLLKLDYLHIELNLKNWFAILRKSYIFVLISFFAGLYYKADIFLLNFLKTQREIGIYSAGNKFLDSLMFIPASYNTVSTPLFAKLSKSDNNVFLRKIKKDIVLLYGLGLSISLAVFTLSPWFLTWFLKGDYVQSIRVVRIVIFALPFILVTSVFFNALYVYRRAYLVLILFISQTVINIVLNIIFIPKFSYIASAYITVTSEVLNTLLAFLLFYKVSSLRRADEK